MIWKILLAAFFAITAGAMIMRHGKPQPRAPFNATLGITLLMGEVLLCWLAGAF